MGFGRRLAPKELGGGRVAQEHFRIKRTTTPVQMMDGADSYTSTDWDMVRAVQARQPQSFGRVVRRHYRYVANLCFRLLLDEALASHAAQRVFLTLHDSLDRVKESGPSLRVLVCQIACRQSRGMARRPKATDETAGRLSPFDPEFVGRAEVREPVLRALRALAALSRIEREAFVLSTVGELAVNEVARVVRAPAFSVRKRISRARGKLLTFAAQDKVVHEAPSPI